MCLKRFSKFLNGKMLLSLFVALTPTLVTFCLITFRLQANLVNFVPSVWNDQVGYWDEVASFQKAGFNTGYYGWDEYPAPAAPLIRSDVHGPLYTITYGIPARFLGWTYYTGIIFNMLILASGILYFIYALKLSKVQIILTGILVSTFSPLILYLPTISPESFFQAATFLFAVMFYHLLIKKETLSPRLKWSMGIILFIISVARSSWALLFFPFFLLGTKIRQLSDVIAVITKSAVLIAFSLIVTSYTSASAPGSNSVTTFIKTSFISPSRGLELLFSSTKYNLTQYFKVFFSDPFSMLSIYRLEYAILSAFFLTLFIYYLIQKRRLTTIKFPFLYEEVCFYTANLIIPWIATMLVYLVAGEHRVLGIHILLLLLLLIKFNRFIIIIPVLFLNLIGLPGLIRSYDDWKSNFTIDSSSIASTSTEFNQYLSYDDKSTNPWCNTVLVSGSLYDYRVMQIPSGMGIMAKERDQNIRFPLKSQYMFLTQKDYDWFYQRGSKFILLKQLSGATDGLYLNLDADCEVSHTKRILQTF